MVLTMPRHRYSSPSRVVAGSRGIIPDTELSIQPALDSALLEAPRSFVITVIINALAPFRSYPSIFSIKPKQNIASDNSNNLHNERSRFVN